MQGTGMEKEKRGGLRLGPRKRTEAPMRWEQTGRDGGANVSEGSRKWERGKSPERDPVQDNNIPVLLCASRPVPRRVI